MLKYATHAQRKCNIANNHTSQPKLDTCILIQKQAPHRLSKLSFKVGDHPIHMGFLKDGISDWAYAHRIRRPLEGSPFQKGVTPHTPHGGHQKKIYSHLIFTSTTDSLNTHTHTHVRLLGEPRYLRHRGLLCFLRIRFLYRLLLHQTLLNPTLHS